MTTALKLTLVSAPSMSEVTIMFDSVLDRQSCDEIRKSPRPVSTAMKIAQDRIGVHESLYPLPAPGIALEGL